MNTFNRILFALIGVALLGAGVVGVASAAGLLDANPVDDLRDEIFAIDWADREIRLAALAAGVLIALMALVLLIREVLPPRRADPMVEVAVSDRGRTRVSKAALRRVYERAAASAEGVASARVADLTISPDGVRVDLDARVNGGYSVVEVGANLVEHGAEAIERTLPDRPGEIRAVVELAHGRRARKRTRRAQ